MEKHVCLNCGAPLTKEDAIYTCPYCRATYEDDAEARASVTLKSLLDEERLDRYSRAKRVLYTATHAKYPSSQEVIAAAQAVLAIEDQDILANVYLFSHDDSPYRLNPFLSSLRVAPAIADEILRWLLPSFHRRSGAALKHFVELNYQDKELTERLTEVEDAIGKLDAGTYEAGMIRDVFLAYSSADMKEVVQLVDLLEENGLTCFAAFRNLRHGKGAAENYLAEIHKAMAACSVFVLVSSPNSLDANCDAVRIELPYLCASLPDKPRIQYVIEDAPHVSFLVNKSLEAAFPTQERCRDEEDLLTRISDLLSESVEETPKPKQFKLSVSSANPSQGTARVAVGEGRVGESVCVTASPKEGYVFAGWYAGSEKVSGDAMYFFAMPEKDVFLTATWMSVREESPAPDIDGASATAKPKLKPPVGANPAELGIEPILSPDGKTITYGLYPQKRVGDRILVRELNKIPSPEPNGFYLYQDAYYAKTVARPDDTYYVFDDGTQIVKGKTYWFKCEPIKWRVLSAKDGTYFILSDMLLDAHRYNEAYEGTKDGYYANNYLNSEIRAWLNGEFLGSAFALADSAILTTCVDNGATTTDFPSYNLYACKYTQDKVFLPSYKDLINLSYGFSMAPTEDDRRIAKVTDWARARGASCTTSSNRLNNGWYWLRSPSSDTCYYAWRVYRDGYLCVEYLSHTDGSIRPAITIKIE